MEKLNDNKSVVDLVKECNGMEITVTLHFDKLIDENVPKEERDKLLEAIYLTIEDLGEYADFGVYERVNVTVEDPAKVSVILKKFGW